MLNPESARQLFFQSEKKPKAPKRPSEVKATKRYGILHPSIEKMVVRMNPNIVFSTHFRNYGKRTFCTFTIAGAPNGSQSRYIAK